MSWVMLNHHDSDQQPRRDQAPLPLDITHHAILPITLRTISWPCRAIHPQPPATHSSAGFWEITLDVILGIITAAGFVGVMVTAH
jgi:hypothetical protein